jgi:hypothetical protein
MIKKILAGVVCSGALLLLGYVGFAFATADGRTRFPDQPAPAIHAATDPAMIEEGR